MIEIKQLNQDDWPRYQDAFLHSELVFPDPIKFTSEDYKEIWEAGECIAKVVYVDNNYAGNIIGSRLTPEEAEEYSLVEESKGQKVIYLAGIVVEPEFQGKGLGKKLLEEFISAAKEQGYTLIAGHFRQNGSYSLIKKVGGKDIMLCKDWSESGEDYILCTLKI